MKNKGVLGTSYWYITLAVIFLAGAGATAYVAATTSSGIKASLIRRTESMAELIPATSLTSLKGSEADVKSPIYQKLKTNFIHIRQSNHDIRFIYILALRPGGKEAFFYLDSEPPESDDYSYPGQSYPEGLADIQTSYQIKHSWVLPVERDRWGVWLSAFSPIFDDQHNVVGILGMDVPAGSYYSAVGLSAAVPFLLGFIVVMGFLLARRRSLHQQQFLNQKAFYLSFASHEIVSPLTSVSWAIRYRRANLADIMPKIEATIGEVLTTVTDVLSLQNLDRLNAKKLNKEPEQISALIDTLITNLSIVCDEHDVRIENKTKEDDKAFSAPVDKLLFKRVIFNLLINAIKYSPKGGIITATLAQNTANWTVSVHNDGQYLTPEDQKRIFEGFYRTKEAESGNKKGTGLGLMLSLDIVKRHGGALTVFSAEGQGVTLTVTMPKV